jgi:hypothetical protein
MMPWEQIVKRNLEAIAGGGHYHVSWRVLSSPGIFSHDSLGDLDYSWGFLP